VKHNLQDQQVYGALFVLRILSRKYEYVSIYSVLIEKKSFVSVFFFISGSGFDMFMDLMMMMKFLGLF
jgi:hypothetical protein